jgi:hypothetical protein
MNDKKHVTINKNNINTIKEFAHRKFLETAEFPSFDNHGLQVFLILEGLNVFLAGYGIDSGFDIDCSE